MTGWIAIPAWSVPGTTESVGQSFIQYYQVIEFFTAEVGACLKFKGPVTLDGKDDFTNELSEIPDLRETSVVFLWDVFLFCFFKVS